MNLHRLAEERSLAYHRAVADGLRRDPGRLDEARRRVAGWLKAGQPHPSYAQAWQELLAGPLDVLVGLLGDESEQARALRQVTPFAGFLDPRERWRLWRAVRARHERSA